MAKDYIIVRNIDDDSEMRDSMINMLDGAIYPACIPIHRSVIGFI